MTLSRQNVAPCSSPLLATPDSGNYLWLDSPPELYPVKYKLATHFRGKYFHGLYKVIQSDTPNWDIVNWHLGRLTNLGAKDLHCVDVGGNFGFFSLHMAAIGCNVQTFEIQPHLVNLESHSFGGSPRASKMEIQNVGLSDNVSVMHFSHAEGIAHLTLDTKASNVEVSVVHGDDCLGRLP